MNMNVKQSDKNCSLKNTLFRDLFNDTVSSSDCLSSDDPKYEAVVMPFWRNVRSLNNSKLSRLIKLHLPT
jgi:hypothetical protein